MNRIKLIRIFIIGFAFLVTTLVLIRFLAPSEAPATMPSGATLPGYVVSAPTPVTEGVCGSWTVVNNSAFATNAAVLGGLEAIAQDNVWVVGSAKTGLQESRQPLTAHWNGVNWSNVSSPGFGAVDSELFDVAGISADDIWAVGRSGDNTLNSLGRKGMENGFEPQWWQGR